MDDIHDGKFDGSDMAKLLLQRFGLRVAPEMGQFVLKRLKSTQEPTIPVLGGDARTGVAVRQLLAVADLRSAMNSFPSPISQ